MQPATAVGPMPALTPPPAPTSKLYFVSDLFGLFSSQCKACHVEAALGGFHVTSTTFGDIDTKKVIDSITSDDSAKFMPPPAAGGKAFSKRSGGDPVLEFLDLFKKWAAAGKPRDAFPIEAAAPAKPVGTAPVAGGPTGTIEIDSYLMSPSAGKGMTNIGNCVPDRGIVGSNATVMDDLDTKFAKATELPARLDETDLTTFDSEALAKKGVIAYAPTYPLWTDEAGKLRMVRVPRNQSIRYNRDTKQLEIPANTRFYKTFLREIIDKSGNHVYRKIETRVIVSRPDGTNPDGSASINALFGTYVWNDQETEALLLRDPLRNGKPFRDRVITLVIDEPKAQKIVDSKPANLKYALEVENTGVVRHYALPGSERCIQCHMGSPSASFILAFSPLQVSRRPSGTGGIYEPAGEDEVTQLQRLIDYKVISGMTVDDAPMLETSQGSRLPRSTRERDAQAYMLGNCAHCHSPRGLPSVKNPDLRALLDFLPSVTGGIFQFPLDRMSPRLKRGADQSVPIPYITPSLRDFPVARAASSTWKPKWIDCSKQPDFCSPGKTGIEFVDAPWRSLIYRNVDNPFMYVDDYVVFPHMPMNSPGYDCRAAHLMAEWMVSIPSKRKSPDKNEDGIPASAAQTAATCASCDTNAQPYEEVKPGEAGYEAALTAAGARLTQYQKGRRYKWCPDTTDIVDRAVVEAAGTDKDLLVPVDDNVFEKTDPTKGLFLKDNVPDRPHFVITDLTDAPGDWYPRRPDWSEVLVKNQVNDKDLVPEELARLKGVVETVRTVGITDDLRSFALTEVPFGIWAKKPECDFSAVPKVSDYPEGKRPRWMDTTKPDAGDPVYTQSPGGTVFNMICVNCHGPQADSRGIQADAVMQMTGGETRVANLRDGLFGPVAMPGANLMARFGGAAGGTAEEWGARYMAWMALGGTKRIIPQSIINIVATTDMLGVQRASKYYDSTTHVTANMLQVAQDLCHHVLPALDSRPDVESIVNTGVFTFDQQTALIEKNGDAELWQRLCNKNNRPVVRVPFLTQPWTAKITGKNLTLDPVYSFYFSDAYPADAPVLDHQGRRVMGIDGDKNLMPFCVRKPDDTTQAGFAQKFLSDHPLSGGDLIPFCPATLFEKDAKGIEKWLMKTKRDDATGAYQLVDADLWASRGAINVGFSVFLYLEQIEKGAVKPKPRYNQCDQLPKSK